MSPAAGTMFHDNYCFLQYFVVVAKINIVHLPSKKVVKQLDSIHFVQTSELIFGIFVIFPASRKKLGGLNVFRKGAAKEHLDREG